ncbi:phage major capsid protein [Nitratireductor basaltis]|uniref:Phage major capsid protein, HK97 family n=1 Tax=Nitratireductor basaltis TaxID=472175 RepID=A0A084U7A9_9HYPH|nr:phage major capsid protein [Nitratireductor basaltis]KFB08845.1 phage major capsid protein, HK97 family [Nitratireductor basaltis]
MPRLQDLKEQRAAKIAEMRTINEKASNDNRDLDDGERKQFDALDKEVRALGDQVDRAEKLAAYERLEAQGEPVDGGEMRRELRSYSLAAAINGALSGRLTGREAEVHQELTKGREARSGSGIHVAVPSEIILGEARSQTVGTPADGGYTVATQLAAVADRFRPALRVESMGATVMRGLSSFLDLPNLAASGSTAWVAEDGNATRSTATFSKVSMAPKTVTGEYRLSRRLILQSNTAIEDLLRRDLGFLLAQALDRAAINGSGTGPEPLGILNTPGVEKVTTEADFSDTTANLIAALELDDVTGTAAFLTNPNVMQIGRKTKDADGHVIPASELFHGGRVEVSTQVPADIGGASDKSALIYGQWGQLYLGYWSAVDILINPYHPDVASNGGALLHAFLDADVAVRHTEAFAFAEV